MPRQEIRDALQEHQQSLLVLQGEVDALLDSDTALRNEALRTECAALREQVEQLRASEGLLLSENLRIKNTLKEQLFNERAGIVNSVQQRAELFFKGTAQGEQNRLNLLEQQLRQRVERLRASLSVEQQSRQAELLQELGDLELRISRTLAEARAAYQPAAGAFTPDEQAAFEALRQEPLTEEQLRESEKKNNLEAFIGQNLINKAGVLLVIIGVIAASQYTLLQLPDVFKGAAMFLLGAAMLLFGELMNRKRPSAFSLGITAGGVAVLYVALSVSYFVLDILGVFPAIAICLLVTATAFFLSRRYDSQTIATFALVGGYLPLLAVGDSWTMVYAAMVYFVLLNLLALLLATQRRWRVCAFIGFGLNLPTTLYLLLSSADGLYSLPFGAAHLIPLVYCFFTFLVYTAVPIVGALRGNKQFASAEVLLLSLNTVFSSLILYAAFYLVGIEQFAGLLAVAFAACYLLLGRFVERRIRPAGAAVLFYLTGFAFVVLLVPLQFGRVWLSLGWLIEGVLLAVYGILRSQERLMRRAGFVICGLCLGAFILIDLPRGYFLGDGLFPWQYLAVTAGSISIWAALLAAKTPRSTGIAAYKTVAAVNLWFYLCYLIHGPLTDRLFALLQGNYELDHYVTYCMSGLTLGLTVLFAYALRHHKLFTEPSLHTLSLVFYAIGCLGALGTNLFMAPFVQPLLADNPVVTVVGTLTMLVVNAAAIFAMRELLLHMVLARRGNLQLYPLLLSSFSLLLMTQVLVSGYQMEFSSMVISLLFMLAAVALVVGGFWKRYPYLRRFGLALSVLSVIKLFLVDLFSLTEGFRILSYFILGVALLGISFVYSYFAKRFEQQEEVEAHE